MSFLVVLLLFVAPAYWVRTGRSIARGAAIVLTVVGAFAAYDATVLLVREYASAQQGGVQPGVILKKLSSTGAEGSERIVSPRSRPASSRAE